jgi:methylated-DNA-[protein]-cysteine S-methyltransferase
MSADRQPTEFEMAVYNAVRTIPCGRVSTYGKIAALVGRGTARSVGSALARNPYAPEVPCHRVVRSNGSLGGFNGATAGPELDRKRAMLVAESVPFAENGHVDCDAIVP